MEQLETKRLAGETGKTFCGPGILLQERTQPCKAEALNNQTNGCYPFVEYRKGPSPLSLAAAC
jgi:hypothetical protein